MKYVAYYIFLWTWILHCSICFSQGSNPVRDWEKEFQILVRNHEKMPDSLTVHLEQLKSLVSNFEKFQGLKDSTYLKLINRLGDWNCKAGNFDQGLAIIESGLKYCKNSGQTNIDPSFSAILYFNLGFYYEKINHDETFQKYMDSCINIAKKFPKRFENGINAYEKLLLHFLNKGEHHRTLELADQGLLFAGNREGNGQVILLYLQKIQALLLDNLLEEARDNMDKVFDILSRSTESEEYFGLVYFNMGDLLEMEGDYQQAISYYQRSVDFSSKNLNYTDSYKALNNIGNIYNTKLGQPQKALESYEKSIEFLQLLDDDIGLATVFNNIGYLHLVEANYEEALSYLQNGFIALPMEFTDTLLFKNPSKDALKNVGNENITFSLNFNKAETLLNYFKSEGNEEYLKAALETFKLADLTINLMRWNQRHDESKLYWREESKEMYELAIETSYLLQDTESALYFFEKSRAVLLNDKLSELGAHQFLSQEDANKEEDLKLEMVSLERKFSGTPPSSPFYQKLSNEKFQIQKTYENFIKSLESKYPRYYHYKYDTTVVSLRDMKDKVLEPDQAYLTYFVGKKNVYALTIDADTAAVYQMPLGQFPDMSEELLLLSSAQGSLNQNYSRYHELAHGMYASFFKPLGLTSKRILISPDDYFIPFEMLIRDPEDLFSFLLKDHAFSYTYSAGFLLKNDKLNRNETATLLGIAPVEFQPHLQQTSLLGSGQSLNRLKEHFSEYQLFTGQQATKDKFLSQLAKNDIVHLYSHAVADEAGTEPRLYFSDSTMLVSELQVLGDLPTQLIILSACNTAVGKNVPGEGVFSLARGFAAAGIPSSITSLWPIDNNSTFLLSEIFYEFLGQGKPTDLALQEAKLRFLRENPGSYQLPYFWAPEVLVGKSFTFNLKSNNKFLVYFIVAIMVLGLIAFRLRKGKFLVSNSRTP